ncbi:flagellar basal body-associated protein FliL [Jannaschia sp. LMIT008]|uniref:flagellar basal body-associated protein FliL n=1 Tax=Jannaschia maritima TaxID=3032585 RepID=UPI00281211A6|nr:flagellar basal body-associated protein FliL [Jannaschia sp. LMIT008]
MKAVLALTMVLGAVAGGGVAGAMLSPGHPAPEAEAEAEAPAAEEAEALSEAVEIPLIREFIVPLIIDGRVRSHVVLTLGLSSKTLPQEAAYDREPVLRDKLMEALFRHASAGGFDGRFTETLPMNRLRLALNEAAQATYEGHDLTVLITSIDRRDR